MKNVNVGLTDVYLRKADHFFQAMQLTFDDLNTYSTGVALLAVHSSISLKDAIFAGVTGDAIKDQDHAQAPARLQKLCGQQHVKNTDGIIHLQWLVHNKTRIAYGGSRIDESFAANAKIRAERFQAWAYVAFKEVFRGSL